MAKKPESIRDIKDIMDPETDPSTGHPTEETQANLVAQDRGATGYRCTVCGGDHCHAEAVRFDIVSDAEGNDKQVRLTVSPMDPKLPIIIYTFEWPMVWTILEALQRAYAMFGPGAERKPS